MEGDYRALQRERERESLADILKIYSSSSCAQVTYTSHRGVRGVGGGKCILHFAPSLLHHHHHQRLFLSLSFLFFLFFTSKRERRKQGGEWARGAFSNEINSGGSLCPVKRYVFFPLYLVLYIVYSFSERGTIDESRTPKMCCLERAVISHSCRGGKITHTRAKGAFFFFSRRVAIDTRNVTLCVCIYGGGARRANPYSTFFARLISEGN